MYFMDPISGLGVLDNDAIHVLYTWLLTSPLFKLEDRNISAKKPIFLNILAAQIYFKMAYLNTFVQQIFLKSLASFKLYQLRRGL